MKHPSSCARTTCASRAGRMTSAAVMGSLALALSLAFATAPTTAQAQEAAVSISIPAQSLGDALLQLGRQTSLQFLYTSDLVRGIMASPVQGTLTPEAALRQLLAGTGIEYTRNGNTINLRRAANVAELAPVQVMGASELTEGSGSYTSDYVSFGKGQSIRELPQSITVVTRQRIEDQSLTTIEDVMRQTTGVTVEGSGLNGAGNALYSRGFKMTSMQVDGANVDQFNMHFFSPNLAMYDSVQIVRGADGLFGGTGSPGGSVNLVRKRPTIAPQFQFMAKAGRWNQYMAEVDVAGPVTDNGKLRGRALLTHQDRDFFFDIADSRSTLLYGILELDASESTRVAIGGSYEELKDTPWRTGLPRAADGADLGLPRSTALVTPWSEWNRKKYEAFAQIEQKLGEKWSVTAQANYYKSKGDIHYGFFEGAIDPATGDGLRLNTNSPFGHSSMKTVDVAVNGRFNLLGREHKVLLGADWRDIRYSEDTYRGVYNTPGQQEFNIYGFDPGVVPAPDSLWLYRSYPEYGAKQNALYGRLNASLTDRLTAIVGARYTNFKYQSPYYAYAQDGSVTSHSISRYKESGILTPYAGLVYDLDDHWTTYASLTEIHESQASRLGGPLPGTPLDAIKGRNYEVGVKGDFMGGRLTTSMALYRIERTGQAVRDPAYPSTSLEDGLNCCWIAQGKIVSQGVDLEIAGELARGWQVFAGYTYNHNQDRNSDVVYSSITPKHMFKLWTAYQLPGNFSAWTVGAGVTAQSTTYVSGTAATYNPATGKYGAPNVPYQFTQPGYAVWNASVQYRFMPDWSLTLNINNLFDKVYYKQVGTSGSGNWYGEPRNLLLTLRGKF